MILKITLHSNYVNFTNIHQKHFFPETTNSKRYESIFATIEKEQRVK